MNQRTVLYIIIGIMVVLLGGLTGYMIASNQNRSSIQSYDECVAAGYPVQESHPQRCAVPEGQTFTQEQSMTLTGRIVCLPHKDTDGPQTMECATGLKTDDGKYYALHTDSPRPELSNAAGSDKTVELTGTLMPSSDTIYQSEGTLHVTDFRFR